MTSRYPQKCVTTWFSACTHPQDEKSRVPHATTLPLDPDCASRLFNASWDGRQDVEAATARWVAWFNRDRLHAELGYLTPFEMEIKYVHEQGLPRQAA